MKRLLVNPPDLKDARAIGYNHGVIAGGQLYSAGQVAMNAEGQVIGDDVATQGRKAYENVATLLGAVGKGIADIAKVTTYIIDPKERYFDGYKEVYWETFDPPYPAHTVLGVDQLANEDYLLEIEVEVPLSTADIEAIEPDGQTIRRA